MALEAFCLHPASFHVALSVTFIVCFLGKIKMHVLLRLLGITNLNSDAIFVVNVKQRIG